MLDWLITPFSYAFMQRAFLASVMVGILCAIVGCYVVLRSMAFLGDALAHAVLPGIAIAYLVGGNLTVGALITAIIVSLGIGFISKQGNIREDTAIGILFTAALSLGIVLISSIRSYAVDLSHILFGDVLGVSTEDLVLTASIAIIILVVDSGIKPFHIRIFSCNGLGIFFSIYRCSAHSHSSKNCSS